MEMTIPQAKKIKLEHSYAFMIDQEPVTIKEEDPLNIANDSDFIETIKIEINEDLVKIEPVDENSEQVENFEYLNVTSDNYHESVSDQCTNADLASTNNRSESEFTTNLDNAVNNSSDPLQILKYEFVEPDNLLTEHEETNQVTNSEGYDLCYESSKNNEPELFSTSKDSNLRMQIIKLNADLKASILREKALQTELGARRMSEIFLEEKNIELNRKLEICWKKEKKTTKLMNDLTQKLVLTQKENTLRAENTERVRREYTDKLDKLRAQMKKKELDHKYLDLRCGTLTHDIARLTAKLDIQKLEMEQLRHTSVGMDKLLDENARVLRSSNERVTELTNEISAARRSNDELQKSLMTEKKMSRLFIKERDQLLDEQEGRFLKAEKELEKLRHSVGELSKALSQKIADCKVQKDAAKNALTSYKKKSKELVAKMEELEKKQMEATSKTCEYCGF